MDLQKLQQVGEYQWQLPRQGKMRVPGLIYGDREQLLQMDDKVAEQLCNVATLPGIVDAAYAMPDAHWGYGFPIGGVAGFDPEDGGIVSAGGVGFDISCGVRTLRTGLRLADIGPVRTRLADSLFRTIPAGVGNKGTLTLDDKEMDAMLAGGARWAVDRGYGSTADLEWIEENGCIANAQPECVSQRAKDRQRREMGTLGSGNHYLELQHVVDIYAPDAAEAYGIAEGDLVVSIHCGSRGLGHQIGTDYLREMVLKASDYSLSLPDRELACAPIDSSLGQRYLGAMRAGMNCALANRQILTHLARKVFRNLLPACELTVLYDVSHNICKVETHTAGNRQRQLYVHRKGATRAFGPGSDQVPRQFRRVGQPVLIGGSMGTASHILAGVDSSEALALSSACHGAGRSMSRNQARKRYQGSQLIEELKSRGILIRSPSRRGVAEEAPGAYKDVEAVVDSAERAGLARKVARLEPVICIKG